MSPIVLWVPKPPDNANGRKHWAVANKEKKAFWDELHVRVACGRLPKAPRIPVRGVVVLAEWFADRKAWAPDKDNCIRRLKPAIDWLVENGYLTSDTAEYVSWADPVVHVGVSHPELCTVRLTLTPTLTPRL